MKLALVRRKKIAQIRFKLKNKGVDVADFSDTELENLDVDAVK